MNETPTVESPEQKAITATMTKFPGARKIPVQNVAYWGTNKMHNSMNFEADKAAYGWKGETLKALRHVLKIQGKM